MSIMTLWKISAHLLSSMSVVCLLLKFLAKRFILFGSFIRNIMRLPGFQYEIADNYEPIYCLFRVLVLSLATFILAIGIFLFSGDPQNMAFAITLLFFLIFAPGISTPVFKFNTLAPV